jgi:hypothetical protein
MCLCDLATSAKLLEAREAVMPAASYLKEAVRTSDSSSLRSLQDLFKITVAKRYGLDLSGQDWPSSTNSFRNCSCALG